MRELLGLGMVAMVGCAAPSTPIGVSTTPTAQPAAPIAPPKPTCTDGESVVYRRPFDDAPEELEVVFTCRDGHVKGESVIGPYEMLSLDPKTGERIVVRSRELEEGAAGVGSLDVASFNALRNRIASEIEEGSCHPPRRWTWTSLGIGTDKWRILCAYEPLWHPVAKGLEDAIERAFEHVDSRDEPSSSRSDPQGWPFEGEYWRDELGYAR